MAKNGERNGKEEIRKATIVYPEVTEEDKLLYSNAILINHTPWDFTLHFNYVVAPIHPPQSSGDIEIRARRVTTINIPPTLLRGLIKVLQANLESYESKYGKIEVPKEGDEE